MSLKACAGSSLTRLPGSKKGSAIDHWLVSSAVLPISSKTKAHREMASTYQGFSDHAAIGFKLRRLNVETQPPPTLRWDKKLLKGNAFELLVHDNWETFDEEQPLDQMADKWHSILETTAAEMGIRRTVRTGRKTHLPRVAARLLTAARKAKELYYSTPKETLSFKERLKLEKSVSETERKALQALKKFEKLTKEKEALNQATKLRSNDDLEFHAGIKSLLPDCDSKKMSQPTPCFNKSGKLCVTHPEIAQAEFEHFSSLAKDQTGVSQDPSVWEDLEMEDKLIEELPIGNPVTPQEFLSACARMNKNAAPGLDGLPPNIFKEILKQERAQHVGLMSSVPITTIVEDEDPAMEVTEGSDGGINWTLDEEVQREVVDTNMRKGYKTIRTKAGTFFQPMDYVYNPIPIKRIQSDLQTPAGKFALGIINKALVTGRPPQRDTMNVVISLNKPNKDPTDLNNRRGITLSTAFLKLIMTIIESRLSQSLNQENFFTPDQGGFRRKEEGIAQFLCLSEVIRRRANVGKPTYVLYIDFKKAFPSVPHEALWKKLRHCGVPENLITFLDNSYKNSRFKMRVGQTLSEEYKMEVGTKEGCPLSPLLFIIFINDLFRRLPGVEVPGLKKSSHCETSGRLSTSPYVDKGKLYADDAAAFFDSPEELQKGCELISEWVEKWQTLKVGHEKCAVVMYGNKDPEERQKFLDTYGNPSDHPKSRLSFQLTDGKVFAQNSYVYLGIPIGHTLGIGYDEEIAFARLTAKKVRMRVGQFACLLKDKNTALYVKTSLIKTYIISTALYGGEWIGMNKTRTRIIQKEVDRAVQMCLQVNKKTWSRMNQANAYWELGIPLISVACAQARHRILAKSGELLTDAKHIFAGKHQGSKKKTWASVTRAEVGKALAHVAEGKSTRPNDMITEGVAHRALKYPKEVGASWIDNNFEVNKVKKIKQERLAVVATLWQTAMDGAVDNKFDDRCNTYGLNKTGHTREFIKTALFYPELKQETLFLVKLRLTAFPCYETLYAKIQKSNSSELTQLAGKVGPIGCPLCKEAFPKGVDRLLHINDYEHLLLKCSHLKELRDKHLSTIINTLHADHIYGGLDDEELAYKLMGFGGELSGPKKPVDRSVSKKGSPAWWSARRFGLGWGHLTGRMPDNMSEYGFVPVSKFMYAAMKLYSKACEDVLGESVLELGEGW
ncbi:hypothetical protein MJO29_015526 [Puccinia striiformis f. sp. tritici]|nr:hypothetical protein MJO29_015526 [Puccinia striiformis f. sp. tritici]